MPYKYPSLRTTLPVAGYYARLDAGAAASDQFTADGTQNGTLTGGATRSGSPLAYSFDGVDDYINCGVFNPTGASGTRLSVAAWVNAGAALPSNGQMVSQYNTTAGARAWQIGITGTNRKLHVQITSDGTATSFKRYESTSDVFNDTWRHIGFSFNSGTLILYVDGAAVSYTAITDDSFTAITNFSSAVFIGARQAGSSFATPAAGSIDDVVISPAVIDATGFAQLASQRGAIYELMADSEPEMAGGMTGTMTGGMQ